MSETARVLVHSYLFLRRAIGVLGTALPFVLVFGDLAFDGGLLGSISGSYYSDMRDVFVGTMCAVGIFLLTYKGYDRHDDIAADVAGIAAIGVALLPTTPSAASGTERFVGVLHLVAAGIFFGTLAYISIVLFRRTGDTLRTRRKRQRDAVYLGCGIAMLACLVLIAVFGLFAPELGLRLHATLWLEAAAIIAFGVSWLTKGQAILADVEPTSAPAS